MLEKSDRLFVVFSGWNNRAIIALCRFFYKNKYCFCVVAKDESDYILKTKYRKYVGYIRKSRILTPDDFISVIKAVRGNRKEIVICPTSEYLNTFVLNHAEEFSKYCVVPLVSKNLYDKVTNKASFLEFIQSHGICIPSTVAPAECSLPFVAKPINNVVDGRSLYPHIIENVAGLERFYATENEVDFFFEEYICGDSFYLCFYIDENKNYTCFWQKNLVQQSGGKSVVVAKVVDFNDELLEMKVFSALVGAGFHGVGMIEFKERDQQYYAIEMNPRFWGPLQLAIDCNSSIVESFCLFEVSKNRRKVLEGGYLWSGGVLSELLKLRSLKLYSISFIGVLICMLKYKDVYFRKDSLRIFVAEFSTMFLKR